MTREDLVNEFIRVEARPGGLNVRVRKITWKGPHSPVSEWVLARAVNGEINEVALKELLDEILRDSKFFRVCGECGERKPLAWMHDKRICQGCAESNHGVTY
jgi:hypothetical protein